MLLFFVDTTDLRPQRLEIAPTLTAPVEHANFVSIHKYRTLAGLRRLYHFDQKWDGGHAAKPRATAINQAIDFLDRLPSNVPFKVMPDPDGSVLLELDHPNRDVILAFEGDEQIVAHHRQDDQFVHQTIPWTRDTRVPQSVRQILGA